jgi:hypothetical protein
MHALLADEAYNIVQFCRLSTLPTDFVETYIRVSLLRNKSKGSNIIAPLIEMAQESTSSLVVEIIAVLVACVGIYVTWRVAKGKLHSI